MSHQDMMYCVDMLWDELEEYGQSYLYQPDWNTARISIFFETIESMAKDYGVVLLIARLPEDCFEIYLRNKGG